LVVVDRVSHPRIDPLVHLSAEAAEQVAALTHALERDVRIAVAAPEKHGRAVHRPVVFARRTWRADHPAAERDDGRYRRAWRAANSRARHAPCENPSTARRSALPFTRRLSTRLASTPSAELNQG